MNIKKPYKSVVNVAGQGIPLPAIVSVATFIRYSEVEMGSSDPAVAVARIVGEQFGFHAMITKCRADVITFSGGSTVEIFWNGVEYRPTELDAMKPTFMREVKVDTPNTDTPAFMQDLPVELD
jgi:hypothetical protein